MDTFGANSIKISSVCSVEIMVRRKLFQFCFYRCNDFCGLSNPWEVGLVIRYLPDFL